MNAVVTHIYKTEAQDDRGRANGAAQGKNAWSRPKPKVYERPEASAPYINCDECKVTYNLTPEQDTREYRRALLQVHHIRPCFGNPEYVSA